MANTTNLSASSDLISIISRRLTQIIEKARKSIAGQHKIVLHFAKTTTEQLTLMYAALDDVIRRQVKAAETCVLKKIRLAIGDELLARHAPPAPVAEDDPFLLNFRQAFPLAAAA